MSSIEDAVASRPYEQTNNDEHDPKERVTLYDAKDAVDNEYDSENPK